MLIDENLMWAVANDVVRFVCLSVLLLFGAGCAHLARKQFPSAKR